MNKIYQFSSIGALMSGYFKPDQNVYEVCTCSSIGLGCSELLNAEVTIVNGIVYTATAGRPTQHQTPPFYTPFYQVTDFSNFKEHQLCTVTQDTLEEALNHLMVLKNHFVAIRIYAVFKSITMRCPQASETPRSIQDVSDHQKVSTYHDLKGCLVGFWTPEVFGRMSVPGFHLHFLSHDHSISGHVLAYETTSATLQFEEKPTIELTNPQTNAFNDLVIDLESLDAMIEHVEK
ncbi:acetolactate decarboxylase [Acinetobacter rathckeae]|uniref:acetolactate decarboxylase n=1 Tax=Acinetobacter rathckeae TaxID=2605272 RepID=UPI0018A28365|nr:acetolactate decarboxylase [Acinetobacter rathckeae]MBF7688088.1 acetolactate decarboxylase [Acinetobacter rathckeae]MBF7695400.1 acetolactate decarboxylase [Acinetobacter rathckeae]